MLRVAIVYWGGETSQVSSVLTSLSKGVETQGHQVKILRGNKDDLHLTGYDYLLIGCSSMGLMSKSLPPSLKSDLAESGLLTGKRCFAYVINGGLRKNALMLNLMKNLEGQGLMVKNFDILTSADEAEKLAGSLHIKSRKL
ncbi:MAG: hypothetical protein PF447_05825 [Spirochaetaceae bacterium]|jgi:hypothetical protein|nr:hypothetical protein [Spirochaetaceae bacterium]